MNPSLALVSLLAGSLACSGDLLVSHAKSTEGQIPVRKTESFVSFTKTQAWNDTTRVCERKAKADVVHLPSGDEYYVGVHTAALAKTAFSLEVTEAGTLKKVTMDSDPQVDETLKAAGEFAKNLASAVETVAPLAAALVATPSEAKALVAAKRACPTAIAVELVPWKCLLSSTTDGEKKKLGCPEPEQIE